MLQSPRAEIWNESKFPRIPPTLTIRHEIEPKHSDRGSPAFSKLELTSSRKNRTVMETSKSQTIIGRGLTSSTPENGMILGGGLKVNNLDSICTKIGLEERNKKRQNKLLVKQTGSIYIP